MKHPAEASIHSAPRALGDSAEDEGDSGEGEVVGLTEARTLGPGAVLDEGQIIAARKNDAMNAVANSGEEQMRAVLMAVGLFALAACGQGGEEKAKAPEVETAPSAMFGEIRAAGTEPFWALHVSPQDGLVFTEAGGQGDLTESYAPPAPSVDGGVFTTPKISLTISVGSCSDGMSDIAYPLNATAVVNGRTLKGCAYYPWGANVRAFIPAIDACLAKAPVRMPVTHAMKDGDVTTVRLSESGPEETYDCVYANGQATVKRSEGQLPGERNPTFYRMPMDDPGESCAPHVEVKDDAGNLLGWTIADGAC